MRAIGYDSYGGPEQLKAFEVPEVHAGPGCVRIRVHAATVNNTDASRRRGVWSQEDARFPPPWVPGMEAAGIIDEVGSGVEDRLRVGDAVMAIVVPAGSHGAYREQIVVDARSVARAPAGAGHHEAATLPMNGLTAQLAIDLLGCATGSTVAITGAAGAVGGYAVQIARAAGLSVVADASEADRDLVASLGAETIFSRGDDPVAALREYFLHGVDGIIDASGVLNERLVPALRDGGSFVSLRGFVGEPQRDIRFAAASVRDYVHAWRKLEELRRQVEHGALSLRVAATYPAEAVAEAHRRLEARGYRGRLVLQF